MVKSERMIINMDDEKYVNEKSIVLSEYICSIVDKLFILVSCTASISIVVLILLGINMHRGEYVDSSLMIGLAILSCVSLMIVIIIPDDRELRSQVIYNLINRKKDK